MNPQVISFRCKMMNHLGKVLSFSYNEEVINQLGDGDPRLRALVDGLQSVREGEMRRISVSANGAFGTYDPSLLIELKIKKFPQYDQVKLGGEVIYPYPSSKRVRLYRVIKKSPTHIVLDGNHPLAGLDLVFEVEIVSARNAEREDLLQENRIHLNDYIH